MMIDIRKLSKVYGRKDSTVFALNQIDLAVEQGEFAAVMGSSGSGKSTLLHMVAAVDIPSSGTVRIDGTDVQKLGASEQARFRRRNIGMIYQTYNLIPTLTVEENIILPLLLDRRKPKQEEVERLLELLGLADRRRHLPNQLSGGQQQRTAIGRALLMRPCVLLADEPTGNLDSHNTEKIIRLFVRANREYGQTILLVTHDPKVGRVAGRQVMMEDGRVVSDNGHRMGGQA